MNSRNNQHDTNKTHTTQRHNNEHMGKFTNIQTHNKPILIQINTNRDTIFKIINIENTQNLIYTSKSHTITPI